MDTRGIFVTGNTWMSWFETLCWREFCWEGSCTLRSGVVPLLSHSARVTFLIFCLMFDSSSWLAPLVSGQAVYSWWAWILFRGKSSLAPAKMDYSNLFFFFFFSSELWWPSNSVWLYIAHFCVCVKTLLLVPPVSQCVGPPVVTGTAQRGCHRYCFRSDVLLLVGEEFDPFLYW